MPPRSPSPLRALEARLRWLVPADLYAMAWIDPSPPMLTRVFEHLRSLQRNLHDYLPRLVTDARIAARVAEPADRRAASAVLADVYALVQHEVVWASEAELTWTAADRAGRRHAIRAGRGRVDAGHGAALGR